MKIVIFGANGKVGQQVVVQALAAGDTVTAMVRQAQGIPIHHPQLRVQVGSVLDPASVNAAVAGQDAVLSTLGPTQAGPVSLCTDAVKLMLEAMAQHAVRRLLVVSAYGVGDSHHRNLYNLALWLSLKEKMLDKERMEAVLQQSTVDWTVARPPALTRGPQTGRYHTGTDLRMGLTSWISHADVADFMLRQIGSQQYLRQTPAIVAQRSRLWASLSAS